MSRRFVAHPKQIKANSSINSKYINTDSTDTSYYDSFLNAKDLAYMQKAKNRTGEVVMMSPQEYYENCAEMFGSSVSSLVSQRERDQESIEWLSNQLDSDKKFYLPYINYADKGQEGLHRMMVLGEKFGWNTKFPVLVVDFLDPRVDEVRKAYLALRGAVREATEYSYTEDDVKSGLTAQIQWEFDKKELDYIAVLVEETDELYKFSIEGFENEVEEEVFKDEIRIREEDDDFDIDDFDPDEDDLDPDILSFLFE